METHDAICPGQKNLFCSPTAGHYLRLAFMVYWNGSPPSVEVFYMDGTPKLTPTAISGLEGHVKTLVSTIYESSCVLRTTYLGYSGIEMEPADVTAVGQRMLS